ncbi:putative inorganic phosphate cotransporter like protein [Argiope bruennichi]|uniref:Putative inorganic phosphate cotransporter like protein n=1 Tax=Argiope bruennichi TaxID=94029 RepID=A0A8T0FHJ3_ARGBR|nr:putative inorganic phosphate cotransporter like protein [Argiope bruennichi]
MDSSASNMPSVKVEIPEKFVSESRRTCYISKRYILTFFAWLGMVNIYAMRVNLSVAMVAMVNNTKSTSSNDSFQVMECPNLIQYEPEDGRKENEGFKGEQYNWDSKAQGIILGSFFYGYILTQLPGGILSERFGGKWLYGGGCLVTAVFLSSIPCASWEKWCLHHSENSRRSGRGCDISGSEHDDQQVVSEGKKRSRISTIIFTGSQIGNVIAMPISGVLSSTDLLGGWPSVFYVFGAFGCIWFLFWCVFVYENPSQHPTISKEELLHIEQNKDEKPKTKMAIPWKDIFTSLPMWAVIIAHIGHNFGFLILLTEMPTYLSGILHFDIKSERFGCIGFLFWVFFVYENPSQHTDPSPEETATQSNRIRRKTKDDNLQIIFKENLFFHFFRRWPFPMEDIFTSPSHVGRDHPLTLDKIFGFLILLTEMPTYLSGILHFDIKSNGLLSALPYIVQAVCAWLVSFLADRIRKSGKMSITTIRKVCNSIGLFGPAVCLLGVTMSGCRPDLIVALLSMSLALNGFIYSGFNVTHVDMSPDLAGTTFAITNATSNVCGVIGPMIVGYFTATGATIANWSDVFYVTAAVYTVCAVFYAIFASAEPQPWGTVNTDTEKKYSLDNIKS